MSYIILFPIIGTIFFLISSVIGWFIFRGTLINKENSNLFSSILSPFIGTTLIISLFSLIYSSFITVNIFVLFLLTVLFFTNFKRGYRNKQKKELENILFNSATFFVLFLIVMLVSVFYDYSDILNSDFLFYAGVIADGIEETGAESTYGYFNYYISGEVFKANPYHYFEFWMEVLLKKITTGYTSVIILKYLVYVFFKSYFILSIFNIFRFFNPKLSLFFILTILLVSFIPIDSFFDYFTNGWSVHASFWVRPNFLTYIFVIVSALPFLINKQYVNSLLILLLLPIVSITTAPVIFTTSFIYIIILYWLKNINNKEFVLIIGSTVVLAILIVLFYYIYGEKKISALENDFTIIEYYKTAWKAMIYYIVTLSLTSLIPLLFLGLINYKYLKNFSFIDLTLYPFISIVSGVLLFQLSFFIDNAYQFSYVGAVFLYVVLLLVILEGLTLNNRIRYIFYFFPAISLLNFALGFNPANLIDISIHNFKNREGLVLNELELSRLKKGGTALVLLNKKDMEGVLPKKRHLLTNLPFSSLFYLGDYEIIPMIDSNDLYQSIRREESFKKAHDFNDRLPSSWKNMANINDVILNEKVDMVVFTKKETDFRKRIIKKPLDSMDLGDKRILFF